MHLGLCSQVRIDAIKEKGPCPLEALTMKHALLCFAGT